MKVPVTQHVINASTFSRKQGSKIIFFLLFGRSKATAFLLCSALLLSFSIYAQNTIPVKGRVTDDKGDPVATASITVKGTATGVSSNANGNFEINAPANGTLVVSFVGLTTREVKAAQNLNVVLSSANQELEQVVVVGYGAQRKKDVTGSVVSVNEKTLREVPAPNLIGQLQGRAAGIDIVSNSTTPGAGGEIRIRGIRSLATTANSNNAQNGPLLVVDGIPYSGSINDLNPDDISNIEILKDASATAIYGSRGSNGVIIISTKRGRTGKAVTTYNTYYGTMTG